MNRNLSSILASILVCLAFGFLTGCSSSSSTTPPPTLAITATSGSGQKANVGDAFADMLVAAVTSNGTAASGVTVTFTPVAGSAGQSCTPSATTATTGFAGGLSANRKLCFWSQNDFTLILSSIESSNAG
jgi:hypothetical protein